jgi:ubiquitin-conjugating enzyme E2 Q
MWDDGLVHIWESGHRFTLLMAVDQYPVHIDRMKFYLGSGPHYKPSLETIEATTRSSKSGFDSSVKPLDSFYLSGPISNYLKAFGRCYKLRTAFELNWNDADAVGLDEMQSHKVFQENWHPPVSRQWDESDPIVMGYEHNLPLVAFWWALRRFTSSPNYCLVRHTGDELRQLTLQNCGLMVDIPSLRPYVCDKPLCLYGFMSLG